MLYDVEERRFHRQALKGHLRAFSVEEELWLAEVGQARRVANDLEYSFLYAL